MKRVLLFFTIIITVVAAGLFLYKNPNLQKKIVIEPKITAEPTITINTTPSNKIPLRISSDALTDTIPEKYTCDGQNMNPPLTISHVPPAVKSFVLILNDPDANSGEGFNHWILYNID